jgi:hypothetical protein
MARCSTARAAAAEGVAVDQHTLVHAAIRVHKGNESRKRESRSDGNGEVCNSIAGSCENLITAAEQARNAAKLRKMRPYGVIRERRWDACEADGGDSVARRPAVDQGPVAGGPGDAGGEAGEVAVILLRCEKCNPQELRIRLRPDILHLINGTLEIFEQKIVSLSDVNWGLNHPQIYENCMEGKSRDVVERRVLYRGAFRAAGRSSAAATKCKSIRVRHFRQNPH